MKKSKKSLDLSSLDVVTLLKSLSVELSFSGKNVTRGWVNTQCPFCGDDSTHLGINLETKNVSCWICRESGSIWKYLKRKLGLPNKEIFRVIKPYLHGGTTYYEPEHQPRNKNYEISLPSHILDTPLKVHRTYLQDRGFNPQFLERIYGIKYTGQIAKYISAERKIDFRFRIIIPIYINGKLVNFTARDVTGQAEEKYKNCPVDDAIMTTKDCIYGYDTIVGDTAVLVEGPTDAWNLGPGAGSILGLKYTDNQLKLLYQRNLKKLIIFFDNEPKAQQIAKKLAAEVGSFIGEVLILEPSNDIDDPGSMTKEQVRKFWNLVRKN